MADEKIPNEAANAAARVIAAQEGGGTMPYHVAHRADEVVAAAAPPVAAQALRDEAARLSGLYVDFAVSGYEDEMIRRAAELEGKTDA